MKYFILSIALVFSIAACKSDQPKKIVQEKKSEEISPTSTSTTIPFAGNWSRSFSMGEGVNQKVMYKIADDKIQYIMSGSMPMQYDIIKDKFIEKDNRWIGHKGDTYYVIFVKDHTEKSINLFKKKIGSIQEGIDILVPSDTTRSQFTSWNVYNKE